MCEARHSEEVERSHALTDRVGRAARSLKVRQMGVERADQTARAAGPRCDGSNDTRAPRGRPDRCCQRRLASIAEQRLDRRFTVEPPQVPNGAARREVDDPDRPVPRRHRQQFAYQRTAVPRSGRDDSEGAG